QRLETAGMPPRDGQPVVDVARLPASEVEGRVADRVDLRVDRLAAGNRRVEGLEGAELTGGDPVGLRDRVVRGHGQVKAEGVRAARRRSGRDLPGPDSRGR